MSTLTQAAPVLHLVAKTASSRRRRRSVTRAVSASYCLPATFTIQILSAPLLARRENDWRGDFGVGFRPPPLPLPPPYVPSTLYPPHADGDTLFGVLEASAAVSRPSTARGKDPPALLSFRQSSPCAWQCPGSACPRQGPVRDTARDTARTQRHHEDVAASPAGAPSGCHRLSR